MKVKDINTYRFFDYTPYFKGIKALEVCDVPKEKRPFDIGDVVYIKTTNALGVVLGCIDYVCEELRTDMDGMQCFSDLELATEEHFKLNELRVTPRLEKELNIK